ncbi:hypothetical protein PVAP13_8NG311831 [Panicum virgatum]|uniref:Uncharacterized protein n=1 Tax=Panicum virgatum TaxID=38727 RepID=A0A8T0PEJ5_PANVG|nr:hypothetical protein PVAP13_8NG311831 [Panicum virgatum]
MPLFPLACSPPQIKHQCSSSRAFLTCSCFAIRLRNFGPLSVFQFLPSPLSNPFGTPPLPGPSIPNQKLRSTILTAILWNIWKRRNALVFRNEHETCHVALRRCAANLYLWRHRMQNAQAKICLEDWSTFLCNR